MSTGGARALSTPVQDPVIEVRAPATGERLGTVPILPPARVRELVDRARAAQPGWAALGPRGRGRVLHRFRAVLADRAEEVAELSSRETGKLAFEAIFADVLGTCELARWYARRAPRVLAPRRVPTGWILTKRAVESRDPHGVVAVIGPWNLPVLNTMRAVLAALAAGNAVVLKPSEISPLTALFVAGLAREAGVPEDVLLVATGGGATGAALLDAGVDYVSFTGSVETGRRVAEAAARRLVPTGLELGGKDAMIVLADAELERAARFAVAGAFWNAGQLCISVERLYAEASVHDALVRRIVEETRALRVGGPADPGADVGAVTTEAQMERLERQVDDALRRGARVAAGGRRLPGPGRFFEPTVLVDVDHSMAVMREESFGPILPVMRVRDAEEAIRLANDSGYALGASLFTRRADAGRLAGRLRAGMVCVNDALTNGMVAALPFTGHGESGHGAVYGDEGLRQMTRPRALLVDRAGTRREIAHYPFRRFGPVRALGLVRLLHGRGLRRRLGGALRLVTGRP